MLFDIKKGCWSEELGRAFGIDISRFSEPVRTGSVIGTIGKRIANELGLPESLTVVAGGHDQILAALGSGAVCRGDSVDGMGSSECITLVLNGEDWTPKMAEYNFCCEPYVFPNTYVTLAFNASSGTASRWYRDCFEAERRDRLHTNLYGLLDEECPKAPTDLLFLPHVAGSGTPYLDSSMGGAALGLKTTTTKAEIYKAVLEGICFEMQWNAELLTECGLSLAGITAVGGSARSETLMQIKADIMNRPVDTLTSTETGTIGLALLCAYALGDITDLAFAAKRAAKKGRTFLPDPVTSAIYADKLRQYKRIYPAMKMIYQK
jgi:xylulokinase